MRVRNEECFVLRTIPISESSLVVDVFTRNYGRISLMAKGARRKKSQFRGSIRPFQLSMANWTGKSEIPLLTSFVNVSGPVDLAGRRVYCSYYLNELIIRFLRQAAPYRELFDVYQDTLEDLADPNHEFHVLRVFELRFLKYLGYELTLLTEANGITPVDPDQLYHYDYETGPIPATHPTENSVLGKSLLAIADEKFSTAQTRKEAHQILKRAIEFHGEGKIDRSRNVFRQTIRMDCQE